MATVMKSLTSTQRIVEWDELPARAREIPGDINPLAEGVLMAHQVDWLRLEASIKIAEKGRRTGITFAEAMDSVITAAARKSAGGDNVYYIGDTKEKGLEFIGYCAKFSRVIASAQGQGVSDIEEFLFADQDESGNTKYITSYRIRYASGFQIVALSSNPANIRGLQGKVIIDEAAFHRDVQGVIDAATALLIWGGRIVIISTHNGKANPFNTLIKDVRGGLYGDRAKVYHVTFDDAVTNGLFERSQLMKGKVPTAEAKENWYKGIRAAYGPRKAQMREELDAIPRDGNGVCIPGVWIEDAMTKDRPVLRLALDSAFAEQRLDRRQEYVKDWIERYLTPALALVSPEDRHFFGMDFARHRDFSELVPMAIKLNRQRVVPFVIELHNVPTRQQEQILWAMIDGLPRFSGGAMDATGSGETLAEYTADKYGRSRIAEVKLSRTWYGTWMPRLIELFEDGVIEMPKDDNLAQDIRAIEMVDGIPMVPEIRRQDLKDPDLYRHGDFAIGLALASYATLEAFKGPVVVKSRPRRTTSNSITKGFR